jgi:hypothetical protein
MIKRKSGARLFVALQGGTRYELALEVIHGFVER